MLTTAPPRERVNNYPHKIGRVAEQRERSSHFISIKNIVLYVLLNDIDLVKKKEEKYVSMLYRIEQSVLLPSPMSHKSFCTLGAWTVMDDLNFAPNEG